MKTLDRSVETLACECSSLRLKPRRVSLPLHYIRGGGGRYFRDFLAIVEKGTYLEGVLTFEGALTFETVRYD